MDLAFNPCFLEAFLPDLCPSLSGCFSFVSWQLSPPRIGLPPNRRQPLQAHLPVWFSLRDLFTHLFSFPVVCDVSFVRGGVLSILPAAWPHHKHAVGV